jgi:hypothetical protein
MYSFEVVNNSPSGTFFHEIRIYEYKKNFEKKSRFLLKQDRIFLLRSKMLLKMFIFKKTLCIIKRKKKKICEKNFLDSEFVKICHEQVKSIEKSYLRSCCTVKAD